MSDPDDLDLAKARSTNARRRLAGTAAALQHRLDPHVVAREAVDGIVQHGANALLSGVDTARRNPFKLVGAVALIAAFLGRRRIVDAIEKARAPEAKKPATRPRVRSTKPRPTPAKRISR